MKNIVAIEQPIFFPWCGYMGLISVSDIYVFYDDVQFERRSWQSRNRIVSTNQEWMYINVPTVKAPRETKINEICIVADNAWKDDLMKKIKSVYSHTPYFKNYYSDIEQNIYLPYRRLVDLNISIIKQLCEFLNIRAPKFILSSEIDDVNGAKSDRIISIMKKIGEETYLSSVGAKGYIEPEKFGREGIHLLWYEFIPETYNQYKREFIPYMSVIDALFNIGPNNTKSYIEEIANRSIHEHSYEQKITDHNP